MRALASELTNGRELRALRVGESLNGDTPQVWALSVTIPRPKGGSLTWQTFQKSLVLGVSDTDGDDRVARAPYMYVLYLYTQWELK